MISREGFGTILFVFIVSVVISGFGGYFLPEWIATILYIVFIVLCAMTVFFFRDPERITPDDKNLVISPADGKVVFVKEIEEKVYLKEKATQISIFLSPLNVHVNRNPVSGLVEYVKYHPGEFLMAWTEEASELNERADFGVLHPSKTKVFFRQITGFLARRIVYNIKEGTEIEAGERFGIMKFGSRMDVVVPANVTIKVKPGDSTVAGESILGVINP